MTKKEAPEPNDLQGLMKFAVVHMDKLGAFWIKVMCSDKTKTELFGLSDKRDVWSIEGEAFKPQNIAPAVKHVGGSIVMLGCFAAIGTTLPTHIKTGFGKDKAGEH